jgi:hypothetical protein
VRTDVAGVPLVQTWAEVQYTLANATDKLSQQAILERWPVEDNRPDRSTLSRWLKRAVQQRLICCSGVGYRGDAFLYWLPGREPLLWPGNNASEADKQAWRDRCAAHARPIAQARHILDPENPLRDLIHAIAPLPGEKYPCIRETMALYALITSGRGKHEIALELMRYEGNEEITVVRTPARTVDLGQDPVAVLGLPMPLKNVVFPQPGEYEFRLLCDGQPLAEEKLLLREER